MKKILALMLALMMAFACAEQLEGGWMINTLEEGETSTDVEYVEGQYAILASQLVNGTNYAVLVRNEDSWLIVYAHEDFDGRTYMLKAQDLFIQKPGMAAGGWSMAQDIIAPELFEKAVAELTGARYVAVATLATQTVAGINYLLLCQVTPVVPDAVTHYALVTVYADLSGDARITEVTDIEIGLD